MNDFETIMYEKVQSLGGQQKPFNYSEDEGLDVLFCKDSPSVGFLTCATLGLVNKETPFFSKGKNIRIELLGLSTTKDGDTLGRIMASLYRNISQRSMPCAYGVIYTGFLEGILNNSEMKHILFTAPPLFWDKALGVVDLDDKNILTWLYAMPISDAEREFVVSKGDKHFKEAMVNLQDIFTVKNVDVFNLNRVSAV